MKSHRQLFCLQDRGIAAICHLLWIAACLACTAEAKPPYDAYVAAGADDANLNALATDLGDRVWAVGDRGIILSTQDGGRNWRKQDSGTTANLHGVASLSSQVAVVVGGTVGPRSKTGRGIVLRTTNGGETWDAIAEMGLPRFNGLAMLGSQLIAWGDYAPNYKSSIFTSQDAGVTWQPLPCSIVHSNALGVSSSGSILAIDRVGNAFSSQAGMAQAWYATSPSMPIEFAMHLGTTWVIGGAEGQLLRSRDGKSWTTLSGPLSPDAQRRCHWRTAHQLGEHVWIAGTPGTILLHSADRGQNWEVQATNQTLPIHAVAFADTYRGWAIGPLGMIQATRDGGKSWYAQRTTATRLGLLSVTATHSQVPWCSLVAASWDERVASASISLFQDDLAQSADYRVETWEAQEESSAQLNLVGHQAWLNEPNPNPVAARAVAERLAIEIQSWRPDVLLTTEQDANTVALISAAMRLAEADGEAGGAVRDQLRLPTWQTAKLSAVTDSKRAQYTEIPSRLMKGPGVAIADILVGFDLPVEQLSMRTLEQRQSTPASAAASASSLFGGIAPATTSKRTVSLKNLGNYQLVMGRAARATSIDSLIAQPQELPLLEWQAQLDFILRALPNRETAPALLRIADGAAHPQLWSRRRIALQRLIQLQPESDAASLARFRLLQLTCSQEMAAWSAASAEDWARSATSGAASTMAATAALRSMTPATPFESVVVPATATEKPAGDQVRLVNNEVRADAGAVGGNSPALPPPTAAQRRYQEILQTLDSISKQDAVLSSSPQMDLLLHSVSKTHATTNAQGSALSPGLEKVASQGFLAGWPQAAQQELLLSSGQAQKLRWVSFALPVDEPPHLDGKFDDPIWQQCPPMELTPPKNNVVSATGPNTAATVRWAYDSQYLYMGIECWRASMHTPAPAKRLRKYDSDLSQVDHLLFTLDTDRDYSSAVELGISDEGETFDRCSDLSAYNPKWSVAVPETPLRDRWTAEIAIRLADLTTESEMAGHAWAISAYRRNKQGTLASWSLMRTPTPVLQAAGLLLFVPKSSPQ